MSHPIDCCQACLANGNKLRQAETKLTECRDALEWARRAHEGCEARHKREYQSEQAAQAELERLREGIRELLAIWPPRSEADAENMQRGLERLLEDKTVHP